MIKFICDDNLGKLARWLRMLGYDTLFSCEIRDTTLAMISRKEKRIVITRDKSLPKDKIIGLHIVLSTTKITDQLQEVIKAFQLSPTKSSIFTRCPLCNTCLESATREKLSKHIPPYVYQHHTIVHQCPKCKKIYWSGTHTEKIIKHIEEIKTSLNT